MQPKVQDQPAGLHIWVRIQGQRVLAGHFRTLDGLGTFAYDSSYLARPDPFAIDPVNLPLVAETEFETRANRGHFGVLLDAGPEAWGQRVLTLLSASPPKTKIEALVAASGRGVGLLQFSNSLESPEEPRPAGASPAALEAADVAIQAIERGEPLPKAVLPEQVRLALLDSAWLGGARPKIATHWKSKPCLAKFSLLSDPFDQVGAEHASLSLARAAGFDVPDCHLITLESGRRVLLIERYDIDARGERLHYISGHSVLNIHRARPDNPEHGYPALAGLVCQFCQDGRDAAHELYRRMALRVLLGDTDDHGRNLGFLCRNGAWHLAPVFDLLPHPDNLDLQAMAIGRHGRLRSLQNLVSMATSFHLTSSQAADVIDELRHHIDRWPDFCRSSGLSEGEITRLMPCLALQQ